MKVDTSIFKGYDIRGIFPDTLNNNLAYEIGKAYVAITKPKKVVFVGEDVRIHSKELKENLVKGLLDSGVDVLDAGLMSTDMLYFAVGSFETDGGIQSTASHNPPEWHGFKMVKKGPVAMTLESGIGEIRDFIVSGKDYKSKKKGTAKNMDIWNDYASFIAKWIKGVNVKPMKVVINPNFGLAGKIFQKIIEKANLPLEIIPLNAEPDGTFPKGRPDPFVPENRGEFVELVKSSNADFGIAWDADADRVFFAADGGLFVEPYYLNTILIKQILNKNPGEKIIFDPRYTWALKESIEESGGTPILVRVGHSYIKEAMRKENALYATESSGHTYYRDYWYADCGMIPIMQLLEYLSLNNIKLSEAVKPVMEKYVISGEINSTVENKDEKMDFLEKKYNDGQQSRLDGISVEYDDWRFCVRPSNTEPLLRLTLEAKSKKLMEEKRDEVLSLIRS